MAARVRQLAEEGHFIESNSLANSIITDGYAEGGSVFLNATGEENVYNILHTQYDPRQYTYKPYVTSADVRSAIHVGSTPFDSGTAQVVAHLLNDIARDMSPTLADLMSRYRVMLYAGQFDMLCGVTFTEALLESMPGWADQRAYLDSKKQVWRLGENNIGGYVKQVGERFYFVVVRGGGHMLPMDKPERSFDMIKRFLFSEPF